ncbi:integrase [Mycobacteroides abscessus]|uniref:tyrosine-type recombinase/integrase n=1 Tax=Mycobacteroides abscessus TaxID=36809 RepID=UPI000E681365|nr:site-specific integrase [Mycobacteroides abscessus]RIS63380.1 integrase [Mycobacteroides abscessus]
MVSTKGHRSWGHIRQLPNKSKRYQASYIGRDMQRHNAPITFSTKMEAEAWLANERKIIERSFSSSDDTDRWTSPTQRAALTSVVAENLTDYATRWIEQRNIKPRTRIHYTSILETHIAPKLGAIPISSLTPATVRTWHAATLTDKPTLRSHAYQLLHAVCATAVKDELLERNPCQIDGATNVKRKIDPAILEIEQLARVSQLVAPKYKALVLISAWCGLRYGEVTELRRSDIGQGCEVISVGRAVTHRGGCRIDTPKSGKPRQVVVPPHIREDIEHHMNSFVAPDDNALLFAPVRGGCHLSDKVVRDALSPALVTVGREGVRIHDLRHFAGTQVARVGNLVETMNHLGHSTVAASLRYQHQVSGRDVEIAAALSALAAG